MDTTGDDTDAEQRKTQKQLYHIRHKLQKLVYEKKPVSRMRMKMVLGTAGRNYR
jgi:hypothetical protein